MYFGGPIRQHVGREQLACKWRRLSGQRLGGSRSFARNLARWIFALLDGEQRIAAGAVEQKHPSVFRCLRHSIYRFSVSLNGNQCGRRRKIAVPEIVANGLEV